MLHGMLTPTIYASRRMEVVKKEQSLTKTSILVPLPWVGAKCLTSGVSLSVHLFPEYAKYALSEYLSLFVSFAGLISCIQWRVFFKKICF